MNQEQVKSTLRTFIAAFGGVIAGFFAGRGWFTADQVYSVLSSETFLGIATSVIVGVWGIFVHTQKNAVAVVAAIAEQPGSPVRGVITEKTVEGRELAESIPGPLVASAGTPAATTIAKATP